MAAVRVLNTHNAHRAIDWCDGVTLIPCPEPRSTAVPRRPAPPRSTSPAQKRSSSARLRRRPLPLVLALLFAAALVWGTGLVCEAPPLMGGFSALAAQALGHRALPVKGSLAVQPVSQLPELPNGCEAASLATLLAYEGLEAPASLLAADYLPRQAFSYSGLDRFGPDPEAAYVGDPFSPTGGWYCFEGPLAQAADQYLAGAGSPLRAKTLTGASLPELEGWLAKGYPVAVWFTQDYTVPRMNETFRWTLPGGSEYTPYQNLHCVVLAGADDLLCYLADPLQGNTQVSREVFDAVYTAMGSRALALVEV